MRFSRSVAGALAAAALVGVGAGVAPAQVRYVEHEYPLVKPIDVAFVDGRHYVLACNVPDNSVEIYLATSSGELQFQQRVLVGLGPVTVRWFPQLNRFYTANYGGDTISAVEFRPGPPPRAKLIATSWVNLNGPCDLAYAPSLGLLLVLGKDNNKLQYVNPTSVTAVGAPTLLYNLQKQTAPLLRNPHRIDFVHGELFMLPLRGDNGVIPGEPGTPGHSEQFMAIDFGSPGTPMEFISNRLGTASYGLAVAGDGTVFVCGSAARNEIVGKQNLLDVAQAPTGFVESHLYTIDDLYTGNPTIEDRDLNRDGAGAVVPKEAGTDPGMRVSMPTDVVLLEAEGVVVRAFVAAFQSDRIIVLDNDAPSVTNWSHQVIDLAVSVPSYFMVGPRGLALKEALADPDDPGARLYCLNRIENSISVIDPLPAAPVEVARVPLQCDPTPDVIRQGRPLLYSARLTSREQNVACASCHQDGRTDGLAWRLDAPTDTKTPPVPPHLVDGVTGNADGWLSNPVFPADKELKTTQTLQGLVNHPMRPEDQSFFSNEPYHWRGDRNTFLDFNEAFVNLMGLPDLNPDPNVEEGLAPAVMTAFRNFINEVMYEPNFRQGYARKLTGALGTPNETTDGTGGELGLKLFHIKVLLGLKAGFPLCAGRSCVGCHQLPDGSTNRIVLRDSTAAPGTQNPQPLEASAMRGLDSREGTYHEASVMPPANLGPMGGAEFPPFNRWSTAGLTQGGLGNLSINQFITSVFGDSFGVGFQPGQPDNGLTAREKEELEGVIAMSREFDTGTANSVGPAVTYTAATIGAASGVLANSEQQAKEAECDVVVFRRKAGVEETFWYDVVQDLYVDGATGIGIDRTTLLSISGADDVVIAQGTWVGSGRRVAHPTGCPPAQTGVAPPTNVELLPMVVSDPWRSVPLFERNWDPNHPTPTWVFFWFDNDPEPKSLRAMRDYQDALLAAPIGMGFGLPKRRHEAPRQFCVKGDGIRHGATLDFHLPAPQTPGTPPPYAAGQIAANTFAVEVPLYPSFRDDELVWISAVMVEPIITYMMMNGGPFAPGVFPVFLGNTASAPLLDPDVWNQHWITVENEGSAPSAGGWAPLRLE